MRPAPGDAVAKLSSCHLLYVHLCTRAVRPDINHFWPFEPKLFQVQPGHASSKHVLNFRVSWATELVSHFTLVNVQEVLFTLLEDLSRSIFQLVIHCIVIRPGLFNFFSGRLSRLVLWIDCQFFRQSSV